MGNKHSIRPSDAANERQASRHEYSHDLQARLSLELSLHDDNCPFPARLEGGNAFHGRKAPMPHAQKEARIPV